MTIVPLKLYFNKLGRAKVEIALARGKKLTTSAKPERSRMAARARALMRQKE